MWASAQIAVESDTQKRKQSLPRLSSRTRCGYFQWIHQAPKPNYVPKTATRAALKKRLNDMVSEKMTFQKRQKTEGGFQFP